MGQATSKSPAVLADETTCGVPALPLVMGTTAPPAPDGELDPTATQVVGEAQATPLSTVVPPTGVAVVAAEAGATLTPTATAAVRSSVAIRT